MSSRFVFSLRKTILTLPNKNNNHLLRQQTSKAFSTVTTRMGPAFNAIKEDHDELRAYYKNILNAKDDDEKTRWQNQFTWELARHSIGEELVLYPSFEKVLPDGKAIADKDREEHVKVKEHLYSFQKLKSSDPSFENNLNSLWKDLEQHMQEEENDELPKWEQALGAGESESIAKSFERTKKFVPTHSHPSAPDKPPFETVVGLMTAPVDKLLDLFKKFPEN